MIMNFSREVQNCSPKLFPNAVVQNHHSKIASNTYEMLIKYQNFAVHLAHIIKHKGLQLDTSLIPESLLIYFVLFIPNKSPKLFEQVGWSKSPTSQN